MQSDSRAGIADGRYVASNGRYWLDLRVDQHGQRAIISGDVQSTGVEAGGGFASFRTVESLGPDPTSRVSWTDDSGTVVPGTVSLMPSMTGGDAAEVTVVVQGRMPGFVEDAEIRFAAARSGAALRTLDLHVTAERGMDNQAVGKLAETITRTFGRAHFDVGAAVDEYRIDAPPGGWSESDIFAQLQTALGAATVSDPNRPDWDLHLLALSRTDRRGLLGIMCDIQDALPRQGAALFMDTISEVEPGRAEQRLLHTAVHELGHALNLRHRFDRDVRRSASKSFMNYDWRYRGGGYVDEYWQDFADRDFDDDELSFLLHAPRSQVVPGGSPFGGAVYWPGTNSGGTGAVGSPWNGLRLWLTPPLSGATFAYGQPVLVEVSLGNVGDSGVLLPRHVLDVKAGRLDIRVRQERPDGTSPSSFAAGAAFVPMLRRCFDDRVAGVFCLRPHESVHTNANLSFGSAGFSFPEPGGYVLTPVLSFPDDGDGLDQIVEGPGLRILVTPAASDADRIEAEDLLHRRDVGAHLALGGSAALQEAADRVEEIRARRQRRIGWEGDPLVAALTRTAGIAEGRKGNVTQAARMLSEVTSGRAASSFDPHTLEHTRRLADRYRQDSQVSGSSIVVVDLWTRQDNGNLVGGRGSGFLAFRRRTATEGGTRTSAAEGAHTAWGVLADASQLPAEAMDEGRPINATVTVSSQEGLTQRISVTRVDLVTGADSSGPDLALLRLSHPVPVSPDLDPFTDVRDGQGRDPLSRVFGEPGTPGNQLSAMKGSELAQWALAADAPIANAVAAAQLDADAAGPPVVAEVVRGPGIEIGEVASWRCWLTWSCEPVPPPYDVEAPSPGVSHDARTSGGCGCDDAAGLQLRQGP